MAAIDTLVDLAKSRRSHYKLGRSNSVPDSTIEKLVTETILHIPSAFNAQSTRLVLLLHEEHDKLWTIVIDAMAKLVETGQITPEIWQMQTKPKLEGFKAGYGTILFYEDQARIKSQMERFAFYKSKLPAWADQSNAMSQWFLWTGLQSLGFGANLQHYNPVIDGPVAEAWDIPSDWNLLAQLVFGSIEGPPKEKEFQPVEGRLKVYGSR